MYHRSCCGYTMIELVVAMVLIGVAGAIVVSLLVGGIGDQRRVAATRSAFSHAVEVATVVEDEIRMATSPDVRTFRALFPEDDQWVTVPIVDVASNPLLVGTVVANDPSPCQGCGVDGGRWRLGDVPTRMVVDVRPIVERRPDSLELRVDAVPEVPYGGQPVICSAPPNVVGELAAATWCHPTESAIECVRIQLDERGALVRTVYRDWFGCTDEIARETLLEPWPGGAHQGPFSYTDDTTSCADGSKPRTLDTRVTVDLRSFVPSGQTYGEQSLVVSAVPRSVSEWNPQITC